MLIEQVLIISSSILTVILGIIWLKDTFTDK